MKVLLIDIPVCDVNNSFETVHKEIIYPSLGLYYLKEYVKHNQPDIEIKILNLTRLDFEQGIEIVLEEKPDVIGVSCFTDRRANVFKFLKRIKEEEGIITVIGGIHPTLFPEQILKNYKYVDFIVRGEGEIIFNNLLAELKKHKNNLTEINGIAFCRDNEIIITKPERLIENLDELPYPKYERINNEFFKFTHYDERYSFNGKKISELKQMAIITSRGCPFNCIYCSTASYWGRRVRYRSPENVISEIEYLHKEHNVEFINFIDDAFTINKERVKKICKLIIDRAIKVCWICETNVKTIDDEMLRIMKEAGCFAINYGVESGSPIILQNIKKSISVKEIEKAIEGAKKNNIIPDIFLMVGNPGENKKTIKETLLLLKRTKPSSGGWGILTIFPGTELYEYCKKIGYINDEYWLTEFSSPFYLYENSYLQLKIFLNKIICFFLWKDKKYNLWLRYKLLEIRDKIFLLTGIRLSFKKIVQINLRNKQRKKWTSNILKLFEI